MRNIVYLNGEFISLAEAKISVLDRGFLFGDGIYEVVPCFAGRLFRLKEHLARLQQSLHLTHITFPNIDFEKIMLSLRKRNNTPDDAIYCQITRGASDQRHLLPNTDLPPTVFIACMPVPIRSTNELRQGMRAITVPDIRWSNCNIKAITLLPNVMARINADTHNAHEVVMIKNGFVTEGCSSNVFIVKNGVLKTPPKSEKILGGITRDLILELVTHENIPFEEVDIPETELYTADEIWLTGSTKEITPVLSLNDQVVGTGKAGPFWEKIIKLYQQYKQDVALA